MARFQYEKLAHIQEVPLFSKLSQRQLRRVAQHADEVTVPEGQVVTREGQRGNEGLIVVVDGKLRVERSGKLLAMVGPGDVIGEMSLIDNQPHSATVAAAAASTLLVIDARSFRPLLEDLPGIKDKIMLTLVERLRAADERLG
jgi:CRP/FNR family transcriptional regulator, cyclic AMP receptor protein